MSMIVAALMAMDQARMTHERFLKDAEMQMNKNKSELEEAQRQLDALNPVKVKVTVIEPLRIGHDK